MGKFLKTCVAFLVLIAIILYLTNPSTNQFKQYLEDEFISQISNNQDSKSALMASKILATKPIDYIKDFFVDGLTKRDDYYFISIYKLNVLDNQLVFIGIFNNFILINGNEYK